MTHLREEARGAHAQAVDEEGGVPPLLLLRHLQCIDVREEARRGELTGLDRGADEGRDTKGKGRTSTRYA